MKLITLNFPLYPFKIKTEGQTSQIFDRIRKKYVSLTPEEWVRQHALWYLIEEKKYPASLFKIETGMKLNRMQKRSDIIVYNTSGKPELVVECKAPTVPVTQETFYQVVRYNWVLRATYIMVTNGINHFVCSINYENNSFEYLKEMPVYRL